MERMLKRLLASVLALSVPVAATAATVSTVDRDGVEVDSIAIAGGKVVGGALDGTPAADLVQVVLSAPLGAAPQRSVEVRLVGGDVLWGSLGEGGADGLPLNAPALGTRAIRLQHVQSIVFAGRLAGAALAALQDRLAADRAGMDHDLCYLTGGDRVRFYLRSVDVHGVKGEDDDARPYAFPLTDVAALSLMSTATPAAAEGLMARLATREGDVLVGALVSVQDGKVSLDHPLLGALAVPLDQCASLDILNGRVRNLSDLEPVEAVEHPYLFDPSRPLEEAAVFRYRRDRQVVDGRPLSIRGRRYARGIGAHAYAELGFALDGAYDRFRSDVGIDDSAAGGGHAEVLVKVDGKERFRATLTGRDPPQRVDVDCRGGKRLTLVVDFGEDRDVLDRVAWAGALLVRRAP